MKPVYLKLNNFAEIASLRAALSARVVFHNNNVREAEKRGNALDAQLHRSMLADVRLLYARVCEFDDNIPR